MSETTITEALAELKVINKRIEKKRAFVATYCMRTAMVIDPLTSDGGSVESIKRELQAIDDLETRLGSIMRAIRAANEATTITLGTVTRSIADWLTWRRDIAPNRQVFISSLAQSIERQRADTMKKGGQFVASTGTETKPVDVLVNINEKELSSAIEELEATLGTLDGQLSLKNATIVISY